MTNINRPKSFSWGRLISDMQLQGLSAMIACHSEPVRYDADLAQGPALALQVNVHLQELSDSPAMDRLVLALKDYFGDTLHLEIGFGPAKNSPASIALSRRVARYAKAYSNIAEDDLIGQMISEFGAKVIVESVTTIKKSAPG